MSDPLPGTGFFGWLGRQVGHIKKAVQSDPATAKITYRNEKVEEMEHPHQPGIKLRRTTIDEMVVQHQLHADERQKDNPPADANQREEGTE